MFAMIVILLSSCSRKKIEPKDDFLTVHETPTKTETSARIKIIEGSQWTFYQIVEVDGHQYLANGNHGGFIHLESCPCKSK